METIRLSQQKKDFRVLDVPYLHSRGVGEIIRGPSPSDVIGINTSRVPQWIEAQARMQPHAIALYSAERDIRLSYFQLNKISNQLARCEWILPTTFDTCLPYADLRLKGVKPNSPVVLSLERGFAIVVWILAVLKAGSCYVILDKTYPLNRKRSILALAKTKFCITDGGESEKDSLVDLLKETTVIESSTGSAESKRLSGSTLEEIGGNQNDLAYSKAPHLRCRCRQQQSANLNQKSFLHQDLPAILKA